MSLTLFLQATNTVMALQPATERCQSLSHFSVMCSVTWPVNARNASEGGGDLVCTAFSQAFTVKLIFGVDPKRKAFPRTM